MTVTINAIIEEVNITIEQGFLTMDLCLDSGYYTSLFGGEVLYSNNENSSRANVCGLFLYRCMQIAGVDNLKDITGKAIRILIGDDDKIEAIGHIVKEDWFDPSQEFKKLGGKL